MCHVSAGASTETDEKMSGYPVGAEWPLSEGFRQMLCKLSSGNLCAHRGGPQVPPAGRTEKEKVENFPALPHLKFSKGGSVDFNLY